MKLKIKRILLATIFIFIKLSTSFAQEFAQEFSIVSDNDAYLWYGQDRYYTNGLFLYYRRAVDQNRLSNKNIAKITYELSIGQQMYTPLSGYVPEPFLQDRPFAGYLYGRGQVNIFSKKKHVWRIGLAAGTIGPNSFSRETQTLLHQTVGLYSTSGWDYQIKNAAAINLQIMHLALLLRNGSESLDLSLDNRLDLGTTFTGFSFGLLFRTGQINPFDQSTYHHARISRNSMLTAIKPEFYFYAKPQLSYVVYDATIQGSMFNDRSPVTFDAQPLVFEQKVGANYAKNRLSLDYSLTFRSKEVRSNARHHQFGTIAASYRF
ncbi:lipid A deacylase LpxR family protein [Sphingobacterium oryzagri]|uniref:Lipid A deacylase LpxR family protein n=1 Tax=Sphingobacterium oryzagri TaxID=3025669 RepID=A0ABY7WF22_9SPHI|nr:lipid A deacylase LpxR family protein [Sphingobacterium sp. KACC 22765]WDF67500.1 lipid A deacylase LpxR family protein [Sphingobacterium sp. KACC 22765]